MRRVLFAFLLLINSLIAGDPSRAALTVLEEIKAGTELKPIIAGMAISRFCGPEKRKVIESNWVQRQTFLMRYGLFLRVEEEKEEGNLAGVLMSVIDPENPESLQILSLGMIKEGGGWKVSPVEGSFENAGLGFSSEVRKQRQELERWLATQRVAVWDRVRKAEEEGFRARMLEGLDPKIFSTDDSRVAMTGFLEAVKEGRSKEVLVWLGVLEKEEFPDRDWERELRATRAGLAGNDQQRAWRLLTSNQVMRRIIETEEGDGDAEYLVAFVHSFQVERYSGNVTGTRFGMTRTPNGWRIFLPPVFASADESSDVFQSEVREGSYWRDRNLAQQIGTLFERETQAIRMAEADALLQASLKDMKKGDLDRFLRKLYREPDPEKKAEDEEEDEEDWRGRGFEQIDGRRTGRYQEMVKAWSMMLGSDQTAVGEVQTILSEGKIALAIITTGQQEQGWKPIFHQLWMKESNEGWLLLPGTKLPVFNAISAEEVEIANRLAKKFEEGLDDLNAKTLTSLLGKIGVDQKEGPRLGEEQARELVKRWREIAKGEELEKLLTISAVMKESKNPTALMRNLNFVRQGAQVAEKPDEILGAKTVGRFVGISLMVDQGAGNEAAFPLVFVVPTQNGHGILIDVELPFETNKGVRLMNEDRLERFEKEMGKDDFEALKELREWHQQTAKPAFEKWKSEKAETSQ